MIKIGDFTIKSNLILAPMAGYSDSPYRRIARRHGSGAVISELISADGIIRRNTKTTDLLRFCEEERPIGIQVFGNDVEVMREAAVIVQEWKPDFIDINMGCSVRRVFGSGSGAALLSKPDLIAEITNKIVTSVSVPVTAKIRIGIDADTLNYIEVVNVLQEAGISLISVHGRTRSQAFRGETDWDIIREIKSISKVPVIGNGDINSYSEAMMRLKISGCDAVMIGRGAIGNPWIFSGRVPDENELTDQIKKHLDLMLDFYGESGIILFRKHAAKYTRGLRNSKILRAQLMRAGSRDDIIGILENNILM
ncbi:MAG: tRNA dihydrouridine synthase DusB [Spirochaetes bacterium]|nr:tRNA dihydrouridine synthase DusB [Spirochaetota bacterium]